MKHFTFLTLIGFFVLSAFVTNAQTYNLCAGTNSTSATSGTIYDSGGPSGSYQNSENCQFLINTGCTGTITLTFSVFNTEGGYDYLSVYNGTNTSAPLLGTYSGSSIPPTLSATSGAMFLRWATDGSVVYSGFAASWSAVVSGTVPPVANFSVSNTNPPLGVNVQFTDQTTNTPTQWLWQFGDGTTSTLQNPTKSYNTSGVKTITLSATNCNTTSVVTKTVNVQSAPSISVNPTSLTATTTCGGSSVIPLTITNNGTGTLTYNSSVTGSSNNVKVLIISNLTYPNYVTNILTALNSYSVNYTVTQHTLSTAAALQSALQNKDVVIFPQPYNGNTYTSGYFQTYSVTINNFVNSGGTAIMSGFYTTNIINDLGLFNSTYENYLSGGSIVNIIDTNNVVMRGLPLGNVTTSNTNYYHTFSNADAATYMKYGTYSLVSNRSVGTGRAIYLSYDYSLNSCVEFNKIMANCVKSSISAVSWLSGSPTSNTVAPSGTSQITYTFNASGLIAGTYTSVISINSNDPSTPTYTVPVTFNVTGAPSSSVSVNCKNFGSIMQYTSKTDSLVLYNTGCATMNVSLILNSNAAYTHTPSTSFSVAAFSNKKIYVKFNPTTVGVINDTLRIVNNGGVQNICLSGTATAAPQIMVSPSSISASVSCGGTSTNSLYVSNSGGSNLTYTATGSSANNNVKVLVISNLTYPNYISNMLSALNSYSVNYTVTQHTLSSVAALQTALSGQDVVIFPQPYNGISYTNGYFQTYSLTINNFVNSGGTAVMSGFYNAYMINDLGLLNSTYSSSFGSGSTINVVDTNNVITTGLPLGNIPSYNYNYYHTFSNSGINNYATYASTYSVISKRNIGTGRAVYLAFDYQTTGNTYFNRVMANSVRSSITSTPWLSGNPTTSVVTPSNTSVINYTLNATGLVAGTYTSVISINSNDPLTPTYTVPVSFSVSGTPSSSVSAACKYFGNVVQYTSKTDSLTLYNTGCATMSVTSLSTSNSVYTYTPSTSFTIAAFSNRKIYVKFTPTTVGFINDTLRITSNGGNQKVCLSGIVTGAPSISVTPSSLSVTLSACNNTQTSNVFVSNVGNSNLTYTLNTNGGPSQATNDFLIIDHSKNGKPNFSAHTTSIITQTTYSTMTLNQMKTNKVIYFEPDWTSASYLQSNMTNLTSYVSQGGIAVINIAGNSGNMNDIAPLGPDYDRTYTHDAETFSATNNPYITGQGYGGFTLTTNDFNYWSNTDHGFVYGLPANTTTIVANAHGPAVVQYPVGNGYVILTTLTFGWGNSSSIMNPHKNIIEYSYFLSQSAQTASWLTTPTNTGVVTAGNTNTVTYTFNSGALPAGTYTSSIVISSNDPLVPTYTVPVTMAVGSNPCADFSYTNSNNCSGIVTFTNTTVNSATSYSWNFGNGTSSTVTSPTVTYGAAGNYSVTLTACTNGSCSSTTKTLSILGVGGPITNSCAPISYSYSSNYGIINVSLNTINKSSGYSYTEGYQDYSCANQTTLTVGQTYTLTVNTSPYYNENCAAWIDFDNNGVFAASEQIMNSFNKLSTHTLTFTPPGAAVLNTPLRMRIIDEYYGYTINSGCYNSYYGQAEDYTIKIQPNNAPPVAAFSTNANSCTGTVNFTDNSYNNPTSWLWNFGDGNASSLQNPSYTYTAAGTYTVLLIASNAYGTNYTSQVVTVNPLTFNIGVDGVMAVGQSLTYTTSLSGGVSYNWNFGDGVLSGSQTTTHTYTAAGTYTVKLTIIYGGCVNTMSTTIVISTGTGIDEHNQSFAISTYPNPFNSYSTIKINLEETLEMEIDILNALGQKVKTIAEKHVYEKGVHEYSTDYLAKGIYFLKVNFKDNTYTYKLISIE